ncbi:HNH endonuclease family protein [Corynebacterium sp. H130]|uniref:HNH endonuclease family protein n=1 Tax=Corynebacterium sp. H130 TaxID=3133444 RepID=UPI0030AD2CE2
MTRNRLFFISLVLTTLILTILDRPTYPSPTPSLNKTLPHVPTVPQRQLVHGYDRDKFGDWAPTLIDGHSCTTRDLILSQAFSSPVSPSCSVPKTAALDPYTGSPLGDDIQIDHIYPLRAAWDLGAHSWSAEQRARFANDPLNLVAVSAAANQEKSDSLPSEWQPTLRTRCWYARRLALIAATYGLPLPKDDIATMKRACYGELLFRP